MNQGIERRVAIAVVVIAAALLLALALRKSAAPSAQVEAIQLEPPTKTIAQEATELAKANAANAAPAEIEQAQEEAQPSLVKTPPKTDLVHTPALKAAFEREAPDATAHKAEAQLRAIYGAERDSDTILRDVRCTRSVCRAELRWSPELNEPYNSALNNALKSFTTEIDLAPDVTLGGPEMPIPMTLFIARPGYSVESLIAEQATQLELEQGEKR